MITTLLLAAALQNAAMPATDVPRCSATVKDECMEGGGMGHHAMGHHAMMHHKMHKKMMHQKMMKADDKMGADKMSADKK